VGLKPHIYRAKVVQNIDSFKSGKIQVRFLQGRDVGDEGLMWCDACTPLGGGDPAIGGAGFFMAPPIGAIVYIMFENGDPTAPIWMGCAYSSDASGTNVMPTEAADLLQEPLNRIIKTQRGHKIEFDDRDTDNSGIPVSGIRLTTEEGRMIEIGDGTGQIRIIDPTGHRIEMIESGIRIMTAGGRGIFFSDDPLNPGVVTANADNDDLGVVQGEHEVVIGAKSRAGIRSEKVFINARSSFGLQSDGPTKIDSGASIDIGAGDDLALGSGNKINITAGENITATGAQTSNIIFDLPIAGTPMMSGNVHMSTMLGTMTMRVGPNVPTPGSPMGFIASTPDFGDPSPGRLSRIAVGGSTGGAVAIEGMFGGVYISPIPVVIPALNQVGIGTRTFMTPMSPPVPVQPAVLGTNLNIWLKSVIAAFQTYFTFIGGPGAAKWGANGGGTLTLSPDVIAAIQAINTAMGTFQTMLATPGPQGFLSSVVYVD